MSTSFVAILPEPPPATSFNTILHHPANKATSTSTDYQEPTTVYCNGGSRMGHLGQMPPPPPPCGGASHASD